MSTELYLNFDLAQQGAIGERVVEALKSVRYLLGEVELRTDLGAWHTGTIAVPYKGKGGVSTTKADWFIFLIVEDRKRDYSSYVFDDKDIRGLIFMKTTELRMISKYSEQIEDESGEKTGFLLPLDRLPIQEFPMLNRRGNK